MASEEPNGELMVARSVPVSCATGDSAAESGGAGEETRGAPKEQGELKRFREDAGAGAVGEAAAVVISEVEEDLGRAGATGDTVADTECAAAEELETASLVGVSGRSWNTGDELARGRRPCFFAGEDLYVWRWFNQLLLWEWSACGRGRESSGGGERGRYWRRFPKVLGAPPSIGPPPALQGFSMIAWVVVFTYSPMYMYKVEELSNRKSTGTTSQK